VLLPFPFSDLSGSKLRPALVLADAGRDDWIMCQITSKAYADPRAIELGPSSFAQGSLSRLSYARPGKLFTASARIIVRPSCFLKLEVLRTIIDAVIGLLRYPAQV
jgi:mRNA interferase MazF